MKEGPKWNFLRRTLFVFMLGIVVFEVVVSVVLTVVLRPNTLRIDTLKPRDISQSTGNVYSGDLEVELNLSLPWRRVVMLGRNEIALAIMATVYMALTIYAVQTALSTNWNDSGVPLSQIVALRTFEDPLQVFGRQTATYRGLQKYTTNFERKPRLPIRRPMKQAVGLGLSLAVVVFALNVTFTWITIGSSRQLAIGGMNSSEYSTVEILVNVPKFNRLNTNLGTRGCQPVPIFTSSLGGHERLNEIIFCTNIIFEGSRYIPIDKTGNEVRTISTADLDSEGVYRSDLVWSGLGPNLLIVPPKICRMQGGPLAFVTANPVTKKRGADVQVEFSNPDGKGGYYKDISQAVKGRRLYNATDLSDDDFRRSQLVGQIISTPCIEWLEATAQGLLTTIQIGLVLAREPRDTLQFNEVPLRSRAALALLVGLFARGLCCLLIFVLHRLFDTRQVDEIIDVGITSAFPDSCSQPLIRQPPRMLFIGLRSAGSIVETTSKDGTSIMRPLAHLQLCSTDLPDESEALTGALIDGFLPQATGGIHCEAPVRLQTRLRRRQVARNE